MPTTGASASIPNSRRTAATSRSGANFAVSTPLGITATRSAGKAFVLDQVLAVRRGHRDERVGDRRQHPVQPADAVRPARAVQRRNDHRHADSRRAAIRPQNILSPAPTVTTASIFRLRNSE